jgi:hypothetical protein
MVTSRYVKLAHISRLLSSVHRFMCNKLLNGPARSRACASLKPGRPHAPFMIFMIVRGERTVGLFRSLSKETPTFSSERNRAMQLSRATVDLGNSRASRYLCMDCNLIRSTRAVPPGTLDSFLMCSFRFRSFARSERIRERNPESI